MSGWKERWKKERYLLFWYGALAMFTIASLTMLIVVWFSGGSETKTAFASGRRLLVKIESGEILGKNVSLDAKKAGEEAASDPVPEPENKPEESPAPATEQKPEEKPEEATAEQGAEAKPVDTAPLEEGVVHTPEEVAGTAGTETVPPAAITKPEAAPTAMVGMNSAIVEHSEVGNLPVIAKDGTKAWRYYSKPFERKSSQPMIAIIVSGLGNNKTATTSALNLPEQITVSFSPYTKDPASWAASVKATGHEMLIDLPMEPANYPASDPGPYGLIINKGVAENLKRLEWQMSRFNTSMGFLTPQNEVFTGNNESFKFLLQSLGNRGLMVVIGREPARKETKDIVDTSATPIAVADVLIDEELSANGIQTRLATLEQQAKKNGYAIGIAQPYPLTLDQLNQWIVTLKEKGIILVPVSAIVKLHFS